MSNLSLMVITSQLIFKDFVGILTNSPSCRYGWNVIFSTKNSLLVGVKQLNLIYIHDENEQSLEKKLVI